MAKAKVHMTGSTTKFDKSLFHKLGLVPIFGLIGLGADSLSSACYGPEEAFLNIGTYSYLSIFVVLLTAITIWTISTSYRQIIELFPYGGGGYVVASKLLTPTLGLISGAALFIDYVLTITISVAAGVDAICSILPSEYLALKEGMKFGCLFFMMLLNLRGVKESIFPLIPIFLTFVFTHCAAFIWATYHHADNFPIVVHTAQTQFAQAQSTLGLLGIAIVVLKSYSLGAGTFTGIEAVSNGANLFREPRAENAKRTMVYMSTLLSIMALGLIFCYLIYSVAPVEGRTLNGVVFSKIRLEIGGSLGKIFELLAMMSEAALLLVAAETGFLGGPRVLSNMAVDRWLPNKFAALSDRYVIRHGLLMISFLAFVAMAWTKGNVAKLVVLYSLSVFITFTLSQLGMVVHWWQVKKKNEKWKYKFFINSFSLLLTFFILISLSIFKFEHGAWGVFFAIGVIVAICLGINQYYKNFGALLNAIHVELPKKEHDARLLIDKEAKVAAIFASGSPGLAIQSVKEILELLGGHVERFVLLHVGIIDAGNFKGEDQINHLREFTSNEAHKLAHLISQRGYKVDCRVSIGLDVTEELAKLAEETKIDYPDCYFFGSQLIFPKETVLSRWLHNQLLFAIRRKILDLGYPFITIPVYLGTLPKIETVK